MPGPADAPGGARSMSCRASVRWALLISGGDRLGVPRRGGRGGEAEREAGRPLGGPLGSLLRLALGLDRRLKGLTAPLGHRDAGGRRSGLHSSVLDLIEAKTQPG